MSAITPISYVSKKTGRPVSGLEMHDGDAKTRPFGVYTKDAMGILRMFEVLGEWTLQVLDQFAEGVEMASSLDAITFGEWKGHAMMHVHGVGGKHPFAMGRSNARKLAHAIRTMGLDEVGAMLADFLAGKAAMPKPAPKAGKAGKAARKPMAEMDAPAEPITPTPAPVPMPKAKAKPKAVKAQPDQTAMLQAMQAQLATMQAAIDAMLAANA